MLATAAALVVLLVSVDGARNVDLDRGELPTFRRLIREGERAEALIPPFPTKTFPSHWSIVTGLEPGEHGIVGNHFYDPDLDETFHYDEPETTLDPRFWGGEPIWVTLERRGIPTATMFWPGSDVALSGGRPRYWRRYDGSVSNSRRVDQVLAWLDLPPGERPAWVSLYFSSVDSAGHRAGPDSPEVARAMAAVDRALGRLVRGLEQRGLLDRVDLIVVSDHGLAATSPDRVIRLADFADRRSMRLVEAGPYASIWPGPGREAEIFAALRDAHPHMKVWRRREIPERFHLRESRRAPPILALADEGWVIDGGTPEGRRSLPRGMHGWDNALPSMHGIFVARGPSFTRGERRGPIHAPALKGLMLGWYGGAPRDRDSGAAVRP